jgi:hypothetical protein
MYGKPFTQAGIAGIKEVLKLNKFEIRISKSLPTGRQAKQIRIFKIQISQTHDLF